jgi:hypothetical protein
MAVAVRGAFPAIERSEFENAVTNPSSRPCSSMAKECSGVRAEHRQNRRAGRILQGIEIARPPTVAPFGAHGIFTRAYDLAALVAPAPEMTRRFAYRPGASEILGLFSV